MVEKDAYALIEAIQNWKIFSANKIFEYRGEKDIAYSMKKKNVNRAPNLWIKSNEIVGGSILIGDTTRGVNLSFTLYKPTFVHSWSPPVVVLFISCPLK